jgi:hypothetical protein
MRTLKPTMLVLPLLEAGLSVLYVDRDAKRREKVSRINVNGRRAIVISPDDKALAPTAIDVMVSIDGEFPRGDVLGLSGNQRIIIETFPVRATDP